MKKIFLSISVLIILCSCKNDLQNEPIESNNIENEQIIESSNEDLEKEKYIDDNPIIVGLYQYGETLMKNYETEREKEKCPVFNVFYTNVEALDYDTQKNNWYKHYNEYQDIDKYRIGFNLTFDTINGKMETNIIEPTNEFFVAPYLFIYLYDDINQPDGTFYSHLTLDDFTEDTIFSSIKVCFIEPENITSPIYLTAFTYDEDDFDEIGNYRGNSKYTMEIDWID